MRRALRLVLSFTRVGPKAGTELAMTKVLGWIDAKISNGAGICFPDFLGECRNDPGACRHLLRLPRRAWRIGNREHAVARGPAGALCADPAVHVSRKAAHL